MRRTALALAVVILSLEAHDASALRLGDEVVIIPIIGRFPGAGGTQWRTDVFLGNAYTPGASVILKFYQSGGPLHTRTVSLAEYSTTTLPDIVLNTFGLANAAGVLEISVPGGRINARARIYNAGNPAGEFGQGVPGIATVYLNRQAYLFGLSGTGGNRLNIGVTNPSDVATEVQISVRDRFNGFLHSRSVTVPPHGNVQYNDIFRTFGIAPQDGVVVQFNTFDTVIYGYASEVRNDTGDAVFTFGLSPNS